MADVFDLLDVIIGKIEEHQLREWLQSFNLDDLVIIELQFDQVGQLTQTSHQLMRTHYCRNQVVSQQQHLQFLRF